MCRIQASPIFGGVFLVSALPTSEGPGFGRGPQRFREAKAKLFTGNQLIVIAVGAAGTAGPAVATLCMRALTTRAFRSVAGDLVRRANAEDLPAIAREGLPPLAHAIIHDQAQPALPSGEPPTNTSDVAEVDR